MKFETIIGLEVHVELATQTKIFCGCKNQFGAPPNTNICPVCLGMPGALPVLNKKVVELAVKSGVALSCDISKTSYMDRKSYFYPDLPKGYQTTQYYEPICRNGFVDINGKRIRIKQIHIEEDAGKMIHESDASYVDFNRCGVPLIEIVSEPDLRTGEDVREYLNHLRMTFEQAGVSDCRMQEGSLRCDINISVKCDGVSTQRTELKNLNSVNAAVHAVEYESNRHIQALKNGDTLKSETRRWDDRKRMSFSMREKNECYDYRYFRDPDFPPIRVSEDDIKNWTAELPELPHLKTKRFVNDYNISEYNAKVISANKTMADYFENTLKYTCEAVTASNLLITEACHEKIPAKSFAHIINMLIAGDITMASAKKLIAECGEKSPEVMVNKMGLLILKDSNIIRSTVQKAIFENPKAIADYKKGKKGAQSYIIGAVMRQHKGRCDHSIVTKIVEEELNKI